MGEGRVVHRVLVGKPEGKRPMGRPRRRWEDNIFFFFRARQLVPQMHLSLRLIVQP
jgi:hypothetical protein